MKSLSTRSVTLGIVLALATHFGLEAEAVRLPDGTFLFGDLGQATETGFVLRRWDDGGSIEIWWDQLEEQERSRIRKKLGLAESSDPLKEAAKPADKEPAGIIQEVRRLLETGRMDQARKRLEEALSAGQLSADASEVAGLQSEIAAREKGIEESRQKADDRRMVEEYVSVARQLLRKACQRQSLTLGELREYVEKVLPGEAASRQTRGMRVSPEQFAEVWKKRDSDKIFSASYGAGSWIVGNTPPGDKTKPASLEEFQRHKEIESKVRELRSTSDLPKSLDDWWEQSAEAEHLQWIEAYWAEKTMNVNAIEYPACPRCAGRRLLSENALCPRCHGGGHERLVKYQ